MTMCQTQQCPAQRRLRVTESGTNVIGIYGGSGREGEGERERKSFLAIKENFQLRGFNLLKLAGMRAQPQTHSQAFLSSWHCLQTPTYNFVAKRLHFVVLQVVLNYALTKGLQYTETTPTFHMWIDQGQSYGLNFTSKEDAQLFRNAMFAALEYLNSKGQLQRCYCLFLISLKIFYKHIKEKVFLNEQKFFWTIVHTLLKYQCTFIPAKVFFLELKARDF